MNISSENSALRGVLYALGAFLIWGLAPIYWKQISYISSIELLGHRILWGFLCLGLLLLIKRGRKLLDELKEIGDRYLLLSSLLIFSNWYLFVWSVNNDHILDASLGYYLTPLINILTGYFFFSERMGRLKLLAIALASLGVGLLFFSNSGSPVISLFLAGTFSLYGFLKKKSKLSAQSALLFEMFVWTIPVAIYFIFLGTKGQLVFLQVSPKVVLYIFMAGVVTVSPLWLFNNAVRHLDLGTVGFLQYIAPSLQLLVGVHIYNEAMTSERLITFLLIWIGIFIYTVDSYRKKRKNAY